MNQILFQKNNNMDSNQSTVFTKKSKFRFIFLICIFFSFLLLIYIFYQNFQIIRKNNLSKKMVDRFEISKLYSFNNSYTTKKDDSSYFLSYSENNGHFDMIGMIKIESLNINYPILSSYSNDLLKIVPCRISGPLPNEIGNLCIAAHNYNNSTFFSNIASLKANDIITIYNSSGKSINYFVYENYEIDYTDLSCMDSTNYREVTLITCNNLNSSKRIIVKAKERL